MMDDEDMMKFSWILQIAGVGRPCLPSYDEEFKAQLSKVMAAEQEKETVFEKLSSLLSNMSTVAASAPKKQEGEKQRIGSFYVQ